MYQGRMLYPRRVGRRTHPRAGSPHPFLYAGARNRRSFANKYFGTQPPGYSAGSAGAPGRVYQHMLSASGRPQSATGFRTSRQLGHFKKGLSSAGKDAYKDAMGGKTKKDFKNAKEYRQARAEARRKRSLARREYAASYKNPYTGTSHRRVVYSSHQDPGTGAKRARIHGLSKPFSEGSRSQLERRRKWHQGMTSRHKWGLENPQYTNVILGNGYKYMHPEFHRRFQAAQRGREFITGLGNVLNPFIRFGTQAYKRAELERNQRLWREELQRRIGPRINEETLSAENPFLNMNTFHNIEQSPNPDLAWNFNEDVSPYPQRRAPSPPSPEEEPMRPRGRVPSPTTI